MFITLFPHQTHFVWEDCNFQTLFEINTYRKKNHEIEIIKKWHSLKDKLFFEINSPWRIFSSSLVYINFHRFCRSVWSRKDFSNLPDILTVSVEKIFLDQRCIFIGCFSLCYPGYSARLALTNGFPPQKGFNHGGISVKLHGFANHYRYAMQTSLFFYSYNSNVHRRPSALLKICLFHYDTSNWQFYENAGIVFFELKKSSGSSRSLICYNWL